MREVQQEDIEVINPMGPIAADVVKFIAANCIKSQGTKDGVEEFKPVHQGLNVENHVRWSIYLSRTKMSQADRRCEVFEMDCRSDRKTISVRIEDNADRILVSLRINGQECAMDPQLEGLLRHFMGSYPLKAAHVTRVLQGTHGDAMAVL